ncbi:integrase [uncultured Pseudomonas sp.]|uniref:integrase n=1 Tax=uncultured Pseudomonas sp. TaxID=114707 RepID=UPI0030D7D571
MNSDFFSNILSGEANSVLVDIPKSQGGFVPSDDFVMCKDRQGDPTAVYGQARWDFNPLRLSVKRVSILNFSSIFSVDTDACTRLVGESKFIIFCLLYYTNNGRIGSMSVATLYNFFPIVKALARYCYEQRMNKLVGVLTLEQVLTTPVYLADFIRTSKLSKARKKILRSLIVNLVSVGEERLGYRVQGHELDYGKFEFKQHPVIPTRIYLGVINNLGDSVGHVSQYLERLENFIPCFTDREYGRNHSEKISKTMSKAGTLRPSFYEAVKLHGLEGFFVGDFACNQRRQFVAVLFNIQYILKTTVHCYTGMRDQEVMRLPFNCLSSAEVSPDLADRDGIVRDKAKIINLVSTTTKFTGYKSEASWLATSEVVTAINAAQSLCRGIARVYDASVEDVPLFLSPSIIWMKKMKISGSSLAGENRSSSFKLATIIRDEDLSELKDSDPSRDFELEKSFAVGSSWPVTSHQFRRSLAFYGSNSGFVSLPSLKKQFKHLTAQMSRYYANNFEKMKTIFGYYDPEKKEFVLPRNHFAFEFQTGVPIGVAYDLLFEVLGGDSKLTGGVGSYIEKQRERLKGGEVLLADLKSETLKRVQDGHISYRRTFLGGCMKSGRCDAYMLGDYASCLHCPESIIKPQNLDEAITLAEAELTKYEVGTGEYQITKGDLDSLIRYKAKYIVCVEEA